MQFRKRKRHSDKEESELSNNWQYIFKVTIHTLSIDSKAKKSFCHPIQTQPTCCAGEISQIEQRTLSPGVMLKQVMRLLLKNQNFSCISIIYIYIKGIPNMGVHYNVSTIIETVLNTCRHNRRCSHKKKPLTLIVIFKFKRFSNCFGFVITRVSQRQTILSKDFMFRNI